MNKSELVSLRVGEASEHHIPASLTLHSLSQYKQALFQLIILNRTEN